MKKYFLITILGLMLSIIPVQTAHAGFSDEHPVITTGLKTAVAVGTLYFLYELLFYQTEVESTREALDQYLCEMQFIIRCKDQAEEDFGSGNCLNKFKELKPSLLLRRQTLNALEEKIGQFEAAFSAGDSAEYAQAYREVQGFIEADCEKELERQERLHYYKRTWFEKVRDGLGAFGQKIRMLWRDEDGMEI